MKRAPERELTIRVGRHTIEVTRPDKVLFPGDGVTKMELVDYYRRIADFLLPHLRGRPVSMQRFPDGIDGEGFYQKDASEYFPDWVPTVEIPKAGGTVHHVVCDNAATLVYLASQACITPHVWLSRVSKLDFPDQMIFDLDPSGAEFADVCAAARSLHDLLERLGLPAYLKTTGSRGLHVMVPLNRGEDFDSVRSFARSVARMLAQRDPARLTTEVRKDKRHGRVFIDTARNAYAQTAAPAYAVRPRDGAPVATPLGWDELGRRGLRPDLYTIRNIFGRLKKTPDPWRDVWRRAVSLKTARQRLAKRDNGS